MGRLIEDLILYIEQNYKEKEVDLQTIYEEIEDVKKCYPLETLADMKLEEYVTNGNQYCFINMIENKTNRISSGFIGQNRNRIFYQEGNNKIQVIKGLQRTPDFKEKSIEDMFKIYIRELYHYIMDFNIDKYSQFKYIENANVIKSKVIFIYRENEVISAFSAKEKASAFAKALDIPYAKEDDSLGINIKIQKYLYNYKPELKELNKYVLGNVLWYFYEEKIEKRKEYIKEDRKNDLKLEEEIDKAKPLKGDSKKKLAPDPVEGKGMQKYPRDAAIAKRALINADFKCECNGEHETFIKKSTNKPYTEPHHLIPVSNQGDFEYSLDCTQNIVSLCSNCHNELHYGKNIEEKLKELFDSRKEALEQVGITITFEKLLSYYC